MNRVLLGVGVVLLLVGVVFVARLSFTAAEPAKADANGLIIDVEDKNPWTSLKLNSDPDQFQFAVVSDRTGGHRPKIFSQAVQRINLMQPEFVLSVGDLIEGYTTKPEKMDEEWKEFNGYAAKFDMPFFYVPGNHDLTNKELNDDWKARFGRKFYHFVYKNVLFFAVNSEDTKASTVTAEQTAYFEKVLAANKDTKWVMIFLHKPLWTAADLDKNGWAAFEKALDGRKYTVFCGHVHRYQKFTRNGMNYYQLATTGGGSRLRGPEYGEFDHITWITMKKDGPLLANVALEGILPEDLKTPESDEKGVTSLRKPPEVFPASGIVTYRGKPLAGATVGFYRKVADTGRYTAVADALTDADGKFKPSTSKAFDGLPEGEFTVTVFVTADGKYYDGEIKQKSTIDAKFADAKTSGVTVTFKKGDSLAIKLDD